MNRPLVALALASFPLVAGAAPPAPTAPVDVQVINPVLPVEISNADPIVVSQPPESTPLTNSMDFVFSVNQLAGTNIVLKNAFSVPMFVTGIFAMVSSTSATKNSDLCQVAFNLLNADETQGIGLVHVQASSSNSMTSPYVPLPRIDLPAGSKYQFVVINETDSVCSVKLNVYSLRQQPL